MNDKNKKYIWDNHSRNNNNLITASLCLGELTIIIDAPSPEDSYWLMSCIHGGEYILKDYSLGRNSQYMNGVQAKKEAIKVFKNLVTRLQDNLNLLDG